MTRQEGFVLAAVVGLFSLLYWKQLWWKGYLQIFLPAFLIVLPFLLHNTVACGNPLYTPYFEGDRLQIVDSWPAFMDNLGGTWGSIDTLWWNQWDRQIRIPLNDTLFLIAAVVGLGGGVVTLSARKKWRQSALVTVALLSRALLITTWWLFFASRGLIVDSIRNTVAGLVIISVIPWLRRTGRSGALIALVMLSQIFIALWFHPSPKHFQQSYPLLTLTLATLLFVWQGRAVGLYRLAVLTPLVLVVLLLARALPKEIDTANQQTALDNVLYQAIQVARQLPGPHGFNQGYLPADLYFGDKAFYFSGDENHTPAEQAAWLQQNHIKTLVVTTHNDAFKFPEPTWQLVYRHKAEGRDERLYQSFVYQLP